MSEFSDNLPLNDNDNQVFTNWNIGNSGTIGRVLRLRRYRAFRKLCRFLLCLLSVDIPESVRFGTGVIFVHNGYGTVLNCNTTIECNVQIYPGVTIGRGDVYNEYNASDFDGFLIKEGAILCSGCKIISSHGKLIVGKGTIIGANAVLTCSTGDNEIWAGIPAKMIKKL